MYLLAILLPPVAVLICGKPLQALINLGLCLFLYIPGMVQTILGESFNMKMVGMVHAIMVVNEYKADRRAEKIGKELQ
jgi:uncharacterized membrane protein YqaE (UPF0057 family)